MSRFQEQGATAVEYGIMLALVAGVLIVVVGQLGTGVVRLFNTVIGVF